ncbi:hypothetical protein V2J09_011744 [Rumex salicifolius]
MSTPPPPHPITSSAAHASLGPVIGVVAVVLILCAVAVVIGRLCSGRSIMGYGHYNMETWVESKFSSCVDGTVLIPPAVASSTVSGGAGGEEALAAASATNAGSSTVEQQA